MLPVIYLHAKGRGRAVAADVEPLRHLRMPLCSRVAVAGLEQTDYGYDEPAALLNELSQRYPSRPVILLRAGLNPGRSDIARLSRLLETLGGPLATTILSNAEVTLNPFAGLRAEKEAARYEPAGLVRLLAPGRLHELSAWPDHFVLLSAEAVQSLAAARGGSSLLPELQRAGGRLLLPDDLFLPDPASGLFTKTRLQPHELARPPAFAELSARLQDWIAAGITGPPAAWQQERQAEPAPGATLHVTHSWGGGVELWVRTFIDADSGGLHYQLCSEEPRSGHGYGQKLALYAGNELRRPIASWFLQPPISSVVDRHADYPEILAEICRRYGIGRVLVSSLIGHSLDALRSGLPTLQVLHDHFPLWPLLSVHPAPFLRAGKRPDLAKALASHAPDAEFRDKNAGSWRQLCNAYMRAMRKYGIKAAAPGNAAMALQCDLEPGFKKLTAKVIPHGFPALSRPPRVAPRPRDDGRLRIVVPGRIQTGKGQRLLLDALPDLSKHAQVYLLGAGESGKAFFGKSGVDVVLKYERSELAGLLQDIGPDLAALLSVVPETFSFTLSELQQLGVPAIATRLGSFAERITDGETGWLIDPEPEALVRRVAALCENPAEIERVRHKLGKTPPRTPQAMVEAYNRFCPARKAETPYLPGAAENAVKQAAAADFQRVLAENELCVSRQQQRQLEREVQARTDWARRTDRQLVEEQERRDTWVRQLDTEIRRLQKMVAERQARTEALEADLQEASNRMARLQAEHAQLGAEYRQLEAQHRQLNARHRQLEGSYRQLQADHQRLSELQAQILASTSWRITRPLRAARRVARNFMLARAWNPARWPWLLSQLVRNLSTLGVAGTLQRMQYGALETRPRPHAEVLAGAVDSPRPPLSFTRPQQVDVSIVIPVYNQWSYTAACLQSLAGAGSRIPFEIIVVDDQSGDETPERLNEIEGIVFLRNQKNLGFVGSCNAGAQRARGEFLVLLNNDTQVSAGWLDALIETFAAEPQAGLVGARLLYPDGRLQEAGGIVFSDGSGWNYGRGDDPSKPDYNFLREVDYCSGACIAMKTALFRELGALDERYAPAYYEDTDLAFRVRAAGHKVMLQPFSEVIHHEGVTAGTDTATGTKQFQLVNQRKFLERWAAELREQPEKINDPDDLAGLRAAARHFDQGRILFIDATTPEPDQDSGSVRLTALFQICRELGFGVTFFADNRAYAGRYTRNLQQHGIEVLYQPWLDSLHDFFKTRGSEFDYVFISRHYVAVNYISMLKRHCPTAKFIFDTVDLHYLRERRLAQLENSQPLKRTAEQTRRSELSVIRAADATLVVSTVEQEVLADEVPGEIVQVLSNIHDVPGSRKGFAERRDLFFVGGYQHPPNVDAACWFVTEIWPLVHRQLPQARFHLIGSKAPEKVRSLQAEGLVFHGFVESLDQFLDGCRLAVAPLRYGAGIKGKVNMSMAHGQPVVATPAAVEGLFAEHEREVLIAAEPAAFASEVVRLYQDQALWERLSAASVHNVEAHFSVQAARTSLLALFEALKTDAV